MHVLVIGGGLAAASAAAELRAKGHPGDITVLTAEPHLPYERPPLSKDLLLGKIDPGAAAATVAVHDATWYRDHQVDLRTQTSATGIDLDRHHVETNGGTLAYDRLLLATGSVPRRLPRIEEAATRHGLSVTYLRSLDDALALKDAWDATPGGQLLVVGAGWIGLEVAAAARLAGWSVTVVDPAPAPLRAALGDRLGAVFADLHRGHGVDLHLNAGVHGIAREPHGRITASLTDGATVAPDHVVIGAGATPADDLGSTAGLRVDNGIWVDARLRASDPAVFAAGDVAAHDHPVLGHRLRVEHWETAAEQGRAAARVMLGDDEPYTRLPYFFTDQYDLGMEYLGHVPPGEQTELIIRWGDSPGVLTAFWVSDRRVLAGAHLNDWDAMEHIRQLVGRRVAVEALRDSGTALSSMT